VIDCDGNDLHGIPILSQLRPKVTSHIVNYAEDLRNPLPGQLEVLRAQLHGHKEQAKSAIFAAHFRIA
jgi:hypothetical protein